MALGIEVHGSLSFKYLRSGRCRCDVWSRHFCGPFFSLLLQANGDPSGVRLRVKR